MHSFEFYNPTRLIFGESKIETLNKYIVQTHKVLVVYGGGSIKRNGIYEKVSKALSGNNWVEFSGIEPNPKLETLMKAVELARNEQVDFILAVGGGSVIDGVKFIASAIHFKEEDPWQIVLSGGQLIKEVVPFGTILTLPATGSEMNAGSVITNGKAEEKRVFSNPKCFPKFSILDPIVIASLPKKQIANGIVDAMVHILEQYLTASEQATPIQDGYAETLLRTLIEFGPRVYNDPFDEASAQHFMLAATYALNGVVGAGVKQDWATHMIGHELTAMFGIDHARTLAIILPGVWEVMFETKQKKLAQYGRLVWNLSGDDKEVAEKAIEKTELFFHSLNVGTRLDDYTEKCYKVWDIPERIKTRGWKLGELALIDHLKVEEILKLRI
ncbi:MAG: iron-containing alcohol dehydrogenase [Bacteroidales bacterium]|nr:iron-containing alcohol dehydrogenase [Bacteroidales bacterium]